MIRPMAAADIPAVRSLQDRLEYADPALVVAAVDGPFYGFVATDGTPVGYCIVFPGDPATLSELVVSPEHRRRGYGRALLERAIASIDTMAIEVSTPVGNTGARRFYTSLGFELEERVSGFYADGTDALRLRRRE